MSSARIIPFSSSARRRRPQVRYVIRRRRRWVHAPGFGLLLPATLVVAFLYLSGVVGGARHDVAYAVLLAAVWSVYFASDELFGTRLGTLLVRAGVLLAFAGVAGFFGGVYWLVWSHP